MKAYLNSIATVTPDLELPIQEMVVREGDVASPALFAADGFATIPVSEMSVIELAECAIQKLQNLAPATTSLVDAVVFCSESFWDIDVSMNRRRQAHQFREDLSSTLHRTGLSNAQLYSVWMSACSNFAAGLSVAASLVESAKHKVVLLLLADRVVPGSSRIMRSGMSILGDGAACCLVARQGAYGIRAIVSASTNGTLSADRSRSPTDSGRGFLAACRETVRNYRAMTHRELSDASLIVADNYHSAFYEIVTSGLELGNTDVHTPTKSRLGHAFSSDCLFGLEAVHNNSSLRSGDEVVLLNYGPVRLGTISLEVF
ncbi:hypothetical protein [Labrenzia sp. DG1229]|uniref:hypothetical protein n=1 Tax=Labrenzia sp. DG1229 TaxID=681847 RepID=UPI00049058AC|nr:hypothetical protein [Labrenzia sp. DG1229]